MEGPQLYTPEDTSSVLVDPYLPVAVAFLLDAWDHARRLRCDAWEFAVSLRTFRLAGVPLETLGWLVAQGYADRASEGRRPDSQERHFRRPKGTRWGMRTCLVLTERGVRFCRQAGYWTAGRGASPGPAAGPTGTGTALRPCWDKDNGQLLWQGEVVKEFHQSARNQRAILQAFQDRGWPPRIPDPLEPAPEQEPKERLHDTVKNLNRHQRKHRIQFMGDGTGQGVRWKYVGKAAR